MSVDSGWGRLTWGQAGWNDATVLTTGFGAKNWNDGAWGDLANDQANLVGQQADTSLGTITLDLTSNVSLSGQEATTNVGDITTRSDATITLNGQSLTSSLGDAADGVAYTLSGQSITGSTGSVVLESKYQLTMTGLGDYMIALNGNADVVTEEVQELTGVSAETQLGTLPNAGITSGWGRDDWGDLQWGDSPNRDVNLVGFGLTASLSVDNSWGQASWGNEVFGGSTDVTIAIGHELSGQEATTAVGTPNFVIDSIPDITGQEITSSVGTPSLEFAYIPTGQSATTNVGSIAPGIGVPITGEEATTAVGDLEIDDSQIINLTGVAATGTTGSFDIDDMIIGINGQENTGGVELTANGDAQLSTAQKKFGTASLLVDGTGDFVKSTNSDVINGDFTIEFFAYASSFAQDAILWDNRVSNSGYAVGITAASQIRVIQDNTTIATGFGGFVNNSFNHIAISRSSGIIRVFVNGNLRGTLSVYNNNYTGQPYYIGSAHTEANFFNGYIDEFRASSVARYTAAFTPPSSEFTVDNDTTTLLHFDGANGSTDIVNEVAASTPRIAVGIQQGQAELDAVTFAAVTGQQLEVDQGTAVAGASAEVDLTGIGLTVSTNSINVQSWQIVDTGTNVNWNNIDTAA